MEAMARKNRWEKWCLTYWNGDFPKLPWLTREHSMPCNSYIDHIYIYKSAYVQMHQLICADAMHDGSCIATLDPGRPIEVEGKCWNIILIILQWWSRIYTFKIWDHAWFVCPKITSDGFQRLRMSQRKRQYQRPEFLGLLAPHRNLKVKLKHDRHHICPYLYWHYLNACTSTCLYIYIYIAYTHIYI